MIKFLKFLRGSFGFLAIINGAVGLLVTMIYAVTETIGVFFNDTLREILFEISDLILIVGPIWFISTILYYLLDKRLP